MACRARFGLFEVCETPPKTNLPTYFFQRTSTSSPLKATLAPAAPVTQSASRKRTRSASPLQRRQKVIDLTHSSPPRIDSRPSSPPYIDLASSSPPPDLPAVPLVLPEAGIGTFFVTSRQKFERLEILEKAPNYWPIFDEHTVFIVDFDKDTRQFRPRGCVSDNQKMALDARIKLEVQVDLLF